MWGGACKRRPFGAQNFSEKMSTTILTRAVYTVILAQWHWTAVLWPTRDEIQRIVDCKPRLSAFFRRDEPIEKGAIEMLQQE